MGSPHRSIEIRAKETVLGNGAVDLKGLALAACFAAACGDNPQAPDYSLGITATEAYTPRVGDVWYFLNGYGDTTAITTLAAPDPIACRSGAHVIWRYRKSAARAYWNPGIEGAEIDFILRRDSDDSWRSTASVIHFPKSCVFCNGATEFTWQVLDNAPPLPNGYRITPPSLRPGERIVYETVADAKGGSGIRTYECIAPELGIVAEPGHGAQWRTEFYLEDVSTPIYSGPAAVSEQRENCNVTFTNPGCGHEKWWFAPGLGLVKVWQTNSTSGVEGDLDPKLTMVRFK